MPSKVCIFAPMIQPSMNVRLQLQHLLLAGKEGVKWTVSAREHVLTRSVLAFEQKYYAALTVMEGWIIGAKITYLMGILSNWQYIWLNLLICIFVNMFIHQYVHSLICIFVIIYICKYVHSLIHIFVNMYIC